MSIAVNGAILSALVDTGAARSMIRTASWEKLIPTGAASKRLEPGIGLRSLSGHLLHTKGVSEIHIYDAPCKFHVVDDLQHDILLGSDALLRCGAEIVYKMKQVMLCGRVHGWYSGIMGAVVEDLGKEDTWRELYPGVFPTPGEALRATDVVEMHIDTGTARPINQRPYRIPLAKRALLEAEVHSMLEEGIIEPSCSPWASPVTMVPKKDGSMRICGDYRKLNAVTHKDAYPMPRIQDIFDQLGGAQIFTTLDLKSGYWQVRVGESSKAKTAISTHLGLFQFTRMQFGLSNAPAVFQRMMNAILASQLGKYCLIYLDDIVIYSPDVVSHRAHVGDVLGVLQQHGLTIKPSKCEFGVSEVKLLGFVVGKEGLKADPEKVSAIRDMAAPTTKQEVRRVLGSANYYRQLMPNYADIVAPITALTGKHVKFVWTEICQKAWEELKELLLNCVVLQFPDPKKPYKLYTDASDYSMGAILVQEDANGIARPVHLISGRFNSAQLNYPTVEKEAYALIFALVKLRPYLYGADVKIYTDHAPLRCLFTKEMKNTRIQRWAILLAEYAAPILYMRGEDNTWADMLSRLRPTTEATEPEEMAACDICVSEEAIPFGYYKLVEEEMRAAQKEMPEWQKGENGTGEFVIMEDLLYTIRAPTGRATYPRLILPEAFRRATIHRAHLDVGHMAQAKTMARIQEHFKWAGMARDVWGYISTCATCQINRSKRDTPAPTAMPLPKAPGLMVAADLTGPFPVSGEGNRYLLSIIDHCTGWVEVKPLPNKSAQGIHKYLIHEYIPRYSAPEVFLTDNGAELKNQLVMGALRERGVKIRHTTPYHPQTNGMVERYHRTLKTILRKLVNSRANRWEEFLGDAILAYRTVCSGSTGFSPFYLTYGRHPNKPFLGIKRTKEDGEEFNLARQVEDLSLALKEAVENREFSRRYNHRRLDREANAPRLEVGDPVMVKVNERGPLDRQYDPGFLITRIQGPVITVVGPENVRKVVNRGQIMKVEPDVNWEGILPRLTRTQRRIAQHGYMEQDRNQQRVGRKQEQKNTTTPPRAGAVTRAQTRRAEHEQRDT